MFSKFPYIVYLNEAEEGEDLGGADRGDDFDPALFEEEDHGAGKPTASKEAEGKEGDKDAEAGKEGDKDAEALDRQIDDLWRDGRWSIADIREEARIYAELF